MSKQIKSNILITSAGRRVELINLWKNEVSRLLGKHSLVFACDLRPEMSAACSMAHESFQICNVQEKNYPELLLKECLKRNIRLIIPTIDNELICLSKFRQKFEEYNIDIVVSDPFLIKNCRDKNLTYELFKRLGLNPPEILDKNKLKFPLIIKPFDGSSSFGIKKLYDESQLCQFDLKNKKNIFQVYLSSDWQEYSVDLLYNKKGFLCCAVPRQRINTRGGEISKGITRRNELYYFLIDKLKFLKGARGVLTLQIFANEKNEFSAIEMNARFGGGYPMSYYSGANFPKLIIKEYLYQEPPAFKGNWKKDNLFLRYDMSTNVRQN